MQITHPTSLSFSSFFFFRFLFVRKSATMTSSQATQSFPRLTLTSCQSNTLNKGKQTVHHHSWKSSKWTIARKITSLSKMKTR